MLNVTILRRFGGKHYILITYFPNVYSVRNREHVYIPFERDAITCLSHRAMGVRADVVCFLQPVHSAKNLAVVAKLKTYLLFLVFSEPVVLNHQLSIATNFIPTFSKNIYIPQSHASRSFRLHHTDIMLHQLA